MPGGRRLLSPEDPRPFPRAPTSLTELIETRTSFGDTDGYFYWTFAADAEPEDRAGLETALRDDDVIVVFGFGDPHAEDVVVSESEFLERARAFLESAPRPEEPPRRRRS